jgi:hypothetical protein
MRLRCGDLLSRRRDEQIFSCSFRATQVFLDVAHAVLHDIVEPAPRSREGIPDREALCQSA